MPEKRGCLGSAVRVFLGLFLLGLLLAAVITGYWFLTPYRGFQPDVFVDIAHGSSSSAIARQLESSGVVRSRWAFLALHLLHPQAPLQAGEYHFEEPATPSQVFDKIRRGDIYFQEFTVPEGSNIFDIATLLQNAHAVKPDRFLKAAADAQIIRDLDKNAPSLEGYLFPSTYRITRKTTARQLCQLMTDEFRRRWKSLSRAQNVDVHRVVTLASLIEREAAVRSDRPTIASVFLNRLRKNMPLQCDPTTVYAALLENRYRGIIHKSDLASTSPYNTYTHAGLPPGPIANPGRSSLEAALQPADTNYLYFVAKADGSGSHVFSSTLAEHEQAVLAYRKNAR